MGEYVSQSAYQHISQSVYQSGRSVSVNQNIGQLVYHHSQSMYQSVSRTQSVGLCQSVYQSVSISASYISVGRYPSFSRAIQFISRSTIVVTSFKFRVSFKEITSLGVRARAVTEWRGIVAGYQDSLNATLWDPDAAFSDVILNVKVRNESSFFLNK